MKHKISSLFWGGICWGLTLNAQPDPFSKPTASTQALKAETKTQPKPDTTKPKINPPKPEEASPMKEEAAGLSADDFLDDSMIDKEEFVPLTIPDTDSEKEIKSRKFDDFLATELQELTKQTPIITCQQLKALLQNNPTLRQLSLIDTRSQDAFEISHIQNARRAGYKDFSNEQIWSLNRKTMMVVYGEASNESEFVAQKLQGLGFQNVYHLYGSITEWMNQGNPVVDKSGKPTKTLLFEDKARTRWLKKGKAITPDKLKK